MTMPDRSESIVADGDHETVDPEMHARLVALRPRIAFPPTPDLAKTVGRAVAAAQMPREPSAWSHRRSETSGRRDWRRATAIAAAVCLIVGAGAVVPATRETVADWFGVPGIQIVFDDDAGPTVVPGASTASAATSAASIGLLLGEPVSLEEARSRVGFAAAVPDVTGLGLPDEVYLRERPGADQVAFLYRPRPGLPAVADTGIGLLLVQFEADDDALWGVKTMGNASEIRAVRLRGREALWLGGAHRLLIAPDPGDAGDRTPAPGAADDRLTGNVLLWAEAGVTYRLESALSLAESLGIAEATRSAASTPVP